MRAAIPRALQEADALAIVANPTARAQLIRRARILFMTRTRVLSTRAKDAEVPPSSDLRWARRIGTYPDAPNRISMHPHTINGLQIMLPLESSLELAHVRRIEFTPTTEWMFTQPLVLMWPVGDMCIYRIPDLIVKSATEYTVVDVKPDEPMFRTPYVNAMFELTADTLATRGWRHEIRGDVSAYARANLRDIAQQRWINPRLYTLVEEARRQRPRSLGGIVDLAPAPPLGMACALHLLAHELEADLDRPLLMGTRVTWYET